MRVSDLFESHSEISEIVHRIRDLKQADTWFNFQGPTVTLYFTLSDENGLPREGSATFRAMPERLTSAADILRRKLSAAARSQQRGKATFSLDDQIRACKEIGPNAIRILTNPQSMVLQSLRWGPHQYG